MRSPTTEDRQDVASYTLDQSNKILPLIQVIAREVVERRAERRRLVRLRDELEQAATPEGLTGSLTQLDAAILEHDAAMERSQEELESLGLTVLRLNPLTVHFPGHTRTGPVVFCWQEGEETICHGHAVGEEEEPRRPLKVRIVESGDE